MKLKEYGKKLGISYQTAQNYYKEGKIPGAYKTPTGQVVVPDDILYSMGRGIIIYIRHNGSESVYSKVSRLSNYCIEKGYKIVDTVIEKGDVQNNYEKLSSIFERNDFDILLVENMDEVYPIAHNILKVVSRNKIHSLIPDDNEYNSLTDLTKMIKNMCKSLNIEGDLATHKTHRILQFIYSELS